jgi:hypothetical protein
MSRPTVNRARPLALAHRAWLGLAGPCLVLLLGVASGGCSRGFVITTPAGFAELEDQEAYAYRATSAEGVVLGVRHEPNEPFGDLPFWTGAVDAQLRRDGYVADKALDVESSNGIPGRQLRYHVMRDGREQLFWSTVYVTDSEVIVVETGGDKAFFEKLENAVSAALASLRIG